MMVHDLTKSDFAAFLKSDTVEPSNKFLVALKEAPDSHRFSLTERELDVVRLSLLGHSTQSIAAHLFLSKETIRKSWISAKNKITAVND